MISQLSGSGANSNSLLSVPHNGYLNGSAVSPTSSAPNMAGTEADASAGASNSFAGNFMLSSPTGTAASSSTKIATSSNLLPANNMKARLDGTLKTEPGVNSNLSNILKNFNMGGASLEEGSHPANLVSDNLGNSSLSRSLTNSSGDAAFLPNGLSQPRNNVAWSNLNPGNSGSHDAPMQNTSDNNGENYSAMKTSSPDAFLESPSFQQITTNMIQNVTTEVKNENEDENVTSASPSDINNTGSSLSIPGSTNNDASAFLAALGSSSSAGTSGLVPFGSLSSFSSSSSSTTTASGTKPKSSDDDMQQIISNILSHNQGQLRSLSGVTPANATDIINNSSFSDLNTPVPASAATLTLLYNFMQTQPQIMTLYQVASAGNFYAVRFLLRFGFPLNVFPISVQQAVLNAVGNLSASGSSSVPGAASSNGSTNASGSSSILSGGSLSGVNSGSIGGYHGNNSLSNQNLQSNPLYPYLNTPFSVNNLPYVGTSFSQYSTPLANNSSNAASQSSGNKGSGGKRAMLSKAAVEILTDWFNEHTDHPYPTDREKENLAAASNLTIKQVNYWFINARVRIWRPKDKQKSERHRAAFRNSVSSKTEDDADEQTEDVENGDDLGSEDGDGNGDIGNDSMLDDGSGNDGMSSKRGRHGKQSMDMSKDDSKRRRTNAGGAPPNNMKRGRGTNSNNDDSLGNSTVPLLPSLLVPSVSENEISVPAVPTLDNNLVIPSVSSIQSFDPRSQNHHDVAKNDHTE